MKKLLFISAVLVLALGAATIWAYFMTQPVSGNTNFKNFLITKGSSAGEVAVNLEKAGLIKSALVFKIYTRLSGFSGNIATGEFRLSPSLNLFQTVDTLRKGPIEIWVTIPEGLRREEIAARFTKALDQNSSFTSEFLDASRGREGTLFPDTYLFPKDASASAIVNRMTRTFSAKTNGLAADGKLTFDQRVILASIIERETKADADRQTVAGILINRLNIGMPLQVDATVQYALASSKFKFQSLNPNNNWWEPIIKDDLSINSPFNTYKFAGLPPAPISNPGVSSLTAAFNPVKTDYLYYIHGKDGLIHYAKTLEGQNANIEKYLR